MLDRTQSAQTRLQNTTNSYLLLSSDFQAKFLHHIKFMLL